VEFVLHDVIDELPVPWWFHHGKWQCDGDQPPTLLVENFEDWTAKVNAVPLDVFSDYFVQLLKMCKKWIAVKEVIVKRIKQFSFDFMCVCSHSINPGTVLFDHILWYWQGQQPYQRQRKNGACCLCKLKVNVAGIHIHTCIHTWINNCVIKQ